MRNATIHILIFFALSSVTCEQKTLPDAPKTKSSPPVEETPVTRAASRPVAVEGSDDIAADLSKEAAPRPQDVKKAEAQPEPERHVTASPQLPPPPTQAQKKKLDLGLATVQVTDRALEDILSYLARLGNVGIVILDDELGGMPITLDIEKTNWRVAIDTIARKFGLHVDDSRIGDHLIVITKARELQEESADAKPIPPLPDLTAEQKKTHIWVMNCRLGAILDYLAQSGGHTLVTPDKTVREMKVTLRLKRVHWRVVLDVLALKYNLEIDESRADEKVLTIRAR